MTTAHLQAEEQARHSPLSRICRRRESLASSPVNGELDLDQRAAANRAPSGLFLGKESDRLIDADHLGTGNLLEILEVALKRSNRRIHLAAFGALHGMRAPNAHLDIFGDMGIVGVGNGSTVRAGHLDELAARLDDCDGMGLPTRPSTKSFRTSTINTACFMSYPLIVCSRTSNSARPIWPAADRTQSVQYVIAYCIPL